MKPKRLKINDIVGVCAPSGVIKSKHKNELEATENLLKEFKINVVYSENLYANSWGYSASVEEKSSDINNLIADSKVKAIIFAKGGSNCNSILDKIDYENLKKNPKFLIGFSDNTILLNAINKQVGLVTYHFTNYKGFCEENLIFNKAQFENVMMNGNDGAVEKNSDWKKIRGGIATGKLVGGNLSSLVKIINTKYCPNFNNSILFLEELSFESDLEMVSSYLYQLKQAQVFEKISGLLIGNYDTQENISLEEIILNVVNEYDFPIVKCDDFGHTINNIVLPIGLRCTLDANKCTLIYDEKTAI